MLFHLAIVSSLTLLIPGLLALVKYRKVDASYYLFFYLLWIGGFNDILSSVLAKYGIHTTINNNLYVLVEAMLLLLFFFRQSVIRKKSVLFILILTLLIAWLLETFVLRTIHEISSYFRVLYCFITVLLSTRYINQLQAVSRSKVLNTNFLICMAFIFYYSLKILVEAFWTFGTNLSQQFQLYLFTIVVVANVIANLIYTIAIYKMPAGKLKSTL